MLFTYLSSLLVCNWYPQYASHLHGLGLSAVFSDYGLATASSVDCSANPNSTSWAKLQPPPQVSDISLNAKTPPLPWLLHVFQPWPSSTNNKGKEKREKKAWSRNLKLKFICVFKCSQNKTDFSVVFLLWISPFHLFLGLRISYYLTN